MKRKRLRIITTAVCILALLFPAASFGAVKTIPDSSVMVEESTRLNLTSSNYSVKWTGVAGKVVTGAAYRNPKLVVPIKDRDKSWSYSDFLDITFKNAGCINGRNIDVKIHVNKLTVSACAKKVDEEDPDGYMAIFNIYDVRTAIGGSGDGYTYHAKKEIDITTDIVWSDTQQRVNLPFFQSVSSLDIINSYQTEAWEGVSGFTGTYYIYKENNLSINGNKFEAGADEPNGILVAGLYAPTSSGSLRTISTVGNCQQYYDLYNQYEILKAPLKSIQ